MCAECVVWDDDADVYTAPADVANELTGWLVCAPSGRCISRCLS